MATTSTTTTVIPDLDDNAAVIDNNDGSTTTPPDFQALNAQLTALEDGTDDDAGGGGSNDDDIDNDDDKNAKQKRVAQHRQKTLESMWNATQAHPHNGYALLLKARILLLMRKPPALAYMTLQKAIQVEPNLYEALTQAGLLLRLMGKPREALTMLQRAQQACQNVYHNNNSSSTTSSSLSSTTNNVVVRRINPPTKRQVAESALDVASLLQQLGDLPGAETAYEQALSWDADYLTAYRSLATLHQKMGQVKNGAAGRAGLSTVAANERALQTLQRGLDRVQHRSRGNLTTLITYAEKLDFFLHVGTLYGRWNEWSRAVQLLEPYCGTAKGSFAWQFLSKCIQAYQALHDYEARDVLIGRLYELHKAGMVPSPKYCREIIATSVGFIHCWEWFDAEKRTSLGEFRLALRWETPPPQTRMDPANNANTEDGAEPPLPVMVTLGSYDETNRMDQQMGKLGPGQRLYQVDKYGANGAYGTLANLRVAAGTPPSYDMIRPLLLAGMVNQEKPPSSFVPESGEKGASESLN